MQRITLVICFFGMFCSSFGQLDYAMTFLNYKRSIPSNFINGEFQIGNSDAMHFFSICPGYNFSKFESVGLSPYFTGNILTDYGYHFYSYESKKSGFNLGIGYTYYFKNLENEKELIPLCGLEFNWYRVGDRYSLNYMHDITGDYQSENLFIHFHSFSTNLQAGFILTSGMFYFKSALILEYFLPMNTTYILPTDKYNPYGGNKLPFVGFEPSLLISGGIKLF